MIGTGRAEARNTLFPRMMSHIRGVKNPLWIPGGAPPHTTPNSHASLTASPANVAETTAAS
jgi:hypothetical protein